VKIVDVVVVVETVFVRLDPEILVLLRIPELELF